MELEKGVWQRIPDTSRGVSLVLGGSIATAFTQAVREAASSVHSVVEEKVNTRELEPGTHPADSSKSLFMRRSACRFWTQLVDELLISVM
jgi:hypothetical protein